MEKVRDELFVHCRSLSVGRLSALSCVMLVLMACEPPAQTQVTAEVRNQTINPAGVANPSKPAAGAATNEDFAARIYTNAAHKTLPYRLLMPKNYDAKQKYPVVLFLHGAAARGDDNEKQLDWGARFFLEPLARDKYPCFLVVPQCPRSSSWVGSSLGGGLREAEPLLLAIQATESLGQKFNIDLKRFYLTGVSMGGHAVWTCVIRQPERFAAGVPVCGSGDPGSVTDAIAKKTPVWAFHSDDDHLVNVQFARDMVKAWKDHGGVAKYTEYTGLKHSSWKKAYLEADLFAWLFAQQRP